MGILNPTPPDLLVDAHGRPYFLWDSETTLVEFREQLRNDDPTTRGYMLGKLMRQAKPDDVFEFVTVAEIRASWPHLEPHLGKTREFWTWLLSAWGELPGA